MNNNRQFIKGANMPKAENPQKAREADTSGVLHDFIESRNSISGYGIFEGVSAATTFAEMISKNQLRQLTRYGIVPIAFINFLEEIGIEIVIIDKEKYVRGKLSEGSLAWHLMTGRCDCKNEQAWSTARYLGKMILLTKHPELARSLRVTQDMESAMRLYASDRR